MKSFNTKKLVGVLLLLLSGLPIFGHGVSIDSREFPPAVQITASYSGGNTISDLPIKIYPPGSNNLYQEGKTDVHGNFSFTPDNPGEWTLIADDGMGHKKEVKIPIEQDFFESPEPEPIQVISPEQSPENKSAEFTAAGIPLLYRILFGFAIIFGLTGMVYGLLSRKKTK